MRSRARALWFSLVVAGVVVLSGCTSADAPAPPADGAPSTTTRGDASGIPAAELGLSLVEVGSGFEAPLLLVADPDGGADLVVEQVGRIVRNDDGHSVALDIRDDVLFGGEQGLLGLAFHPNFDDNGLAYVNYVDASGSTVIEEFPVVDGVFEIAGRRTILRVAQPARNHNGGMIAFGPNGYLWIGMGDGGAANDRFENGQNSESLLGAMLRIDIDGGGDMPYAIPPDNPYADGLDGAPEVWATGLRNPWRFSFDAQDVWIADVGQNEVEEVNRVSAADPGLNFGWPVMEGSTCFEAATCDAHPYVAPVDEYFHNDGCSITGGYVYRGDAIPWIDGEYFYSDFCTGFLRSYSAGSGTIDWTAMVGATAGVTGFGIGGDGELYVVSQRGSIQRLEEGP